MGAAMTTLYGYLYLLLRLEDYALLAGSVGLFVDARARDVPDAARELVRIEAGREHGWRPQGLRLAD